MAKDKVILWKHLSYDINSGKEADYNVNSISINSLTEIVQITIERRGSMEIAFIEMSMSHAKEIGFINLNTLNDYCNF